jgi:hypothetical protein
MKKFIFLFLFFLCLSFNNKIVPAIAAQQTLKQGLYPISSLGLSPNTKHIVQNNSFSTSAYVLILDSKPNLIQSIRLRAQSKKYNLIPIKDDYTIVVIGDGEITIS